MLKNRTVAEFEIDAARKNLAEFEEFRQREWAENRRAYDTFFSNLALFAGGTVALSVTYLGYLQSRQLAVAGLWLLGIAWVFLILATITSLFCSYVFATYLYFARQSEAAGFEIKRCETEIAGLPNIPDLKLTTGQPLNSYIESLKGDLPKLQQAKSDSEKRKNRWWKLRKLCGRTGQTSFVLGLVSLLLFAFMNL
jgi:hypothetical protein